MDGYLCNCISGYKGTDCGTGKSHVYIVLTNVIIQNTFDEKDDRIFRTVGRFYCGGVTSRRCAPLSIWMQYSLYSFQISMNVQVNLANMEAPAVTELAVTRALVPVDTRELHVERVGRLQVYPALIATWNISTFYLRILY